MGIYWVKLPKTKREYWFLRKRMKSFVNNLSNFKLKKK
jgi:hypothetical protein